MGIDDIHLADIIEQYPHCLNNVAKLRGILLDLYPSLSKGVLRAVLIVAESGIVNEIQKRTRIDDLERNRWQKILETDWCMSAGIESKCIELWVKAIETIQKCKIDLKNPKYVYHKQLGYGEIRSYGKTITIRFSKIPYKLYTYRVGELQSFLKIISEKEYEENIKSSFQIEDIPIFNAELYYNYDLTLEFTDDEINKELNRIILEKAKNNYGYNYINEEDY